ncbi:CAP domain-containing protein [Sedimentibacter sp.]|uniref:CAP domain-containing protein n=1 Tax=Sedimentibacter sp. TaxID=1960295 RepID=UPI0028AC36C8|nr:CAP domain-containing protein [Sedimentibacter sp.]
MKNKILALALGTILALSSTTAFAADMNTGFNNFNGFYNFFNSFNTNYTQPAKSYNEPQAVQTTQQAEADYAQPQQNAATTSAPAPSSVSFEERVAQLVNVERQKNGLQPLTFDESISNVARLKSKDMADNNYFAHQSPRYGSAGDMLRNNGINWSAWGENIASGQRTPETVVTAWMNSEGHRANILSPNFGKIGVGYVTNSNGTPYWTQMFTN